VSILDKIFKRKPNPALAAALDRFDTACTAHEKSQMALQTSIGSLQQAVTVNQIVRQEETKTIRRLAGESGATQACKPQCSFCQFFKESQTDCMKGTCSQGMKKTVPSDYSCPFFEPMIKVVKKQNAKAAS
jgi:hypothetical protein